MKFLTREFIKKHVFFLILIPLVFTSQNYLLKPHLKYGFDDTADQYISEFRQLREKYPNPIQFVTKSLDTFPFIYLHQYYYVGFLNYLFGDNLIAYHQATHLIKSLAVLSTYPLFFILSESSLVAFISSLMFAISYASAGGLEGVIFGGDYLAIVALSIFLTIYFYLVRKRSDSNKLSYLTGLIFLVLSLAISTVRAYPVVLIVVATEVFMLLRNRSAESLKLSLKRMAIFLLPIVLVIIINPGPITQRVNTVSAGINEFIFSRPTDQTSNSSFPGGGHELLLIPFLSFASTILPSTLWPANTVVPFFLLTIIIGWLLSKKPWRFILVTFLVWTLGFLIVNWSWSTSSTHNLVVLETKSIIGFYFLGLASSFLIEWLQTENSLYIGLFLGPILSFIFIFSIWLGTQERLLLFANIHRYLTISSVFISFFTGSLIVVLYRRFKDIRLLKIFSYYFFLLIPVFLTISSGEINKFFNERYAYGFTIKDMDYMRRQLLPYLKDPFRRLIYIDTSFDKKNDYFYGQVYRYGPLYWLSWYDNSLYNINFDWSHETVPHSIFDYNLLKSSVKTRNGITGIAYPPWSNDPLFYTTDKFSAVRVIDKKVIDIKEEVVKDLGLTP